MASPVGHALAGLAVGRAATRGRAPERLPAWGAVALCMALGIAADLDFVPGLLEGRPAAYHQGASHSFAAMLAAGAAAAALFARGGSARMRWTAVFALAYATHLGLDWLGSDVRPPFGIPLFWPFSEASFLSPVPLLPGVSHASSADVGIGEWLAAIFSVTNALAILAELAWTLPLVFAVEWWRQQRPPAEAG